ncbi:MAG: UvrD-helicase domain-containing protein [Phycisphaerae bacterium]|nr:UvrD-helicase domain-containing protein [Phycisphaerae bacterium]
MSAAIPPLTHERILASAGSGKTFRLSGRLIEIARRDPTLNLSQLLASTFTRAAAAEIRDRVFLRLADAARDAAKRAELAVGTPLPPPDQAEALALLRRFVASVDQLQLRTLDSLFASTAGAFAVELGLPPEPRIVDEYEREQLALDAVDRMLAADDAPALLASVAALNKGRARLTVASAVLAATQAAASVLAESEPGAWDWPLVPVADASAMQRAIDALAACPKPENGHHAKALTQDLARVRAAGLDDLEAWAEIANAGFVKQLRVGSTTYHKKPIDPAILAAARPFLAHAQALAYNEAVRRTEATRTLAERFLAAFAEVKRERGAVTFDDITRAVADASSIPEFGELFFRLDAVFAHALFDEFQDTSAVQWRALAPIARELAAGDAGARSLFVVGDLKQSIYRWRGATPELLDRLGDLVLEDGSIDLKSTNMAESFRSSQVVLDAIDDVFRSLPGNPALAEAEDVIVAAAKGWMAAWETPKAARDVPGVVELHVAAKVGRSGSAEQQGEAMATAARLVAELRAEAPGATIGVLCRRNRSVGDMLNRLRTLGVAASARGGGSLQDAASVNAALDAIVLADHPDHTIACFHVAHSPLGPVLEIDADAHTSDRMGHRHARSASIRRTLTRLGYAETLRRWRDALVDSIDAREMSRFEALIEAAATFDGIGHAARRPADVVAALRALQLDERSEAPTVVMNIHQSKGLEFDAVVLCDIDRSFAMRAELAATRSRPDGRFTRVIRWPARETLHPALVDVVERVMDESYREQLSLLYVALTRARRGLFVVTEPASDKDGEASFRNSFAGLVRGAWCPGRTEAGVETVAGSRDALRSIGARTVSADPAPRVRRGPIVVGPPRGARVVAGARASGTSADVSRDPGRETARERGIAAHAMLESIEWLEGEPPAVDALVAAARHALPRARHDDLVAVASWLRARLGQAQVRDLFRKPAEAFLVRREFPFVRATGGELERGTIDRLVLFGAPGRVERAAIVDFKTDRDVEAGPERGGEIAPIDRYRPQLDAYRRAVSERFLLAPGRVSAALVLLDAGSVVPA